jgi:hypothetical protein
MLVVFAQFTIKTKGTSSRNLDFQRFINVWTRVTDFNEIMERRRDDARYFEIEQNGEFFIETYFTDEEASHLMKHFPSEFSVLVY